MKACNRIGGIEEINVPDREAAVWTKAKSKERKPRLGGYSGLDKVTGNHNISSKNDKQVIVCKIINGTPILANSKNVIVAPCFSAF